MKILTDIHTHTSFSPDGIDSLPVMVERAVSLGYKYYGISEHFDYDYKVDHIPFENDTPPIYTNAKAYFSLGREMQIAYKDKIQLLIGGEFGFTENKEVVPLYQQVIQDFSPDFIVNSVHTQGHYDYYVSNAYENQTKEDVYLKYFSLVEKSLDASYPFDIIGHLGYCSRYAPFENKKIHYSDYAIILDKILNKIISKDKILEINTSSKGSGGDFLPDIDILSRYYQLGGRKVSFASDAHFAHRIGEKRELVMTVLKKIGFTNITIPFGKKYLFIPIE